MSLLTWNRLRLAVVAFVAVIVGLHATFASAQLRLQRMTLPEMVEQADAVMVATCVKKEVLFRDGGIVSRYQIKPNEFLKGSLSLSSAGEFVIEQPGGSVEEPIPLTQYVPSSALMVTGQEVLMFTQERKPADVPAGAGGFGKAAAKAAPMLEGPALVSGDHGVFSIIKNPETGEKIAIQGSAAGRQDGQQMAKVLEARKRADQAAKKLQAQQAKAAASASADQEEEGKPAIEPVQPLNNLASQVRQLVKNQPKKQ